MSHNRTYSRRAEGLHLLFSQLGRHALEDARSVAKQQGINASEQTAAASVHLTGIGTGIRLAQTYPELADELLGLLASSSLHPEHPDQWRTMFDEWIIKALAEVDTAFRLSDA
jgi:hypothetical protein